MKPIHIVINGLSALIGGGQTYLINLLRFASEHTEIKVTVLSPPELANKLHCANVEVITIPYASKGLLQRTIWEIFSLPNLLRELKADVVYFPGGSITSRIPKNMKSAVAFRNMLPFSDEERKRYPLGFKRARLFVLRFLQLSSFRRADLVIFISNYAKTVIDRFALSRRGKNVIIPHGISEQFRRSNVSLPKPTFLPQEYVLYVSILNPYKAQLEVIDSWYELRKSRSTNEKLVLVGEEFPSYGTQVRKRIQKYGLENEVLYLGKVNYQDLPAVYQNAKVNLFASSCENCPNILLEALGSGTPVLSSSYQPMPEFAENGAVYFDPYKPSELAQILADVLDTPNQLEKMASAAFEQSKKFDWRTSANLTWCALIKLAQEVNS